jgi:hypothetical protein
MIDRIDSSIDAETFFEQYISVSWPLQRESSWTKCEKPRKPVIFRNLLDDPSFHGSNWTPEYLKANAGSRELTVEPRGKAGHFGSSEPRVKSTLSDFLDSLEKQEDVYLTTQYDDLAETDDVTVLSPPCDLLTDDFPLKPRLMGNLFLQQVNLWIGSSKKGASSGLVSWS